MTSAVYRGSAYLFCSIYVPLVGQPTYYHGKQLRSCLDALHREKTLFSGFPTRSVVHTDTHRAV